MSALRFSCAPLHFDFRRAGAQEIRNRSRHCGPRSPTSRRSRRLEAHTWRRRRANWIACSRSRARARSKTRCGRSTRRWNRSIPRTISRSLMQQVHPDAKFRDAATEMTRKASAAATALSLNREVYQALSALDLAKADAATRHYVSRQLLQFRLAGRG